MSVGFIPPDQNKPGTYPFRKDAPTPANTCAPGKPGNTKAKRRLAARIKGYEDLVGKGKMSDCYHKPGSLRK